MKNCDVRGLFEDFLKIANEPELPDDIVFNRCAGKFVEIIARVSSHISDENPLHSEEAIRMRQYVDKNTHRFVSIAELADSISRSLDYTAKLFKAEFDITPYEYQIRQKMLSWFGIAPLDWMNDPMRARLMIKAEILEDGCAVIECEPAASIRYSIYGRTTKVIQNEDGSPARW